MTEVGRVSGWDRHEAAVLESARAYFETPWGEGDVAVADGRLVEVRLPWSGCARESEAGVAGHRDGRGAQRSPAGGGPSHGASETLPTPTEADRETAAGWARELGAYFEGEMREWPAEAVDLDGWDVTPFRRAVYRALLEIPPGATVSYGELARMAGAPRAARAVGSAMAANPVPIVVPCHRVIRADGSPGRYGECDAWKVELLRHEGAL